MQIVVGHANPDFDAYASTVAATKLFPGAKGVFLGSQNANVRAFHNLHEEFLEFVDQKALDLTAIDRLIMVDTRDPERLAELSEVARRPGVEVIVYDHHPAQADDITGADDRSVDCGATTSILVHALKERGIDLTPLEASVMLLGIHEDTGSLTYPGTTAFDAQAAAWLMGQGADIEVLNEYLLRTLDVGQRDLLGQLTASMETWDVNGQKIAVGTAHAEEYVDSAGVLTHYVVEDMGFRVALAVVSMPGRTQVVARSRLAEVDVGAAMGRIGGGGHAQAASASFRDKDPDEVLALVRGALSVVVRPPLRAVDVMSRPVRSIPATSTMHDAGVLMARWGHGGLPITDGDTLLGLVTRKDADKATRHGLDHAPVTGFMSREVLTVPPETDVYELERLLASRGIGRVPVVEHGRMVGIVTRKDVLRAEHGDAYVDRRLSRAAPEATTRFLSGIDSLPPEARQVVRDLGTLAEERGVRAHVVGGFVRDMLLGRPNLDIDVVVEGDGIAFAEAFAEAHSVRPKVHRRFGTAVIAFSRDFHVDIASARTEYYTKPGALPTVERSSLRQDLFRRDFTINALAACLEPACFGAIADPFSGLRDLDNKTVRVLHALSFVDDPTRVLRAARFEQRYGFLMDPSTEALARQAVEIGMLDEVSGSRIREELLGILDEEVPARALGRLRDLGALAELLPADVAPADALAAVAAADEARIALDPLLTRPVSRRTLLLAALVGTSSRVSAERWLRHLRIGREHAEAALVLAERHGTLLRDLKDRRGMRDSRLYRLLEALPAATVVCLWAAGDSTTRARVERFYAELVRMTAAVSGADLIAVGATPSPSFSAILARALEDRLDGRAVGRTAELVNLRRLARNDGLIGQRKDHS